MTGTPKVSVAVSTYQRGAMLPRLVAALEAQTLPPESFEVVIADNGSTDDTARVLAELAARSPLDLRVVRVERNEGPAKGRNAAWRATRAPIVAFTDDDCVPTPGWLQAGVAALDSAHRVVVGRTIPNPDQLADRGPFSLTVTVEETKYFHTCNIFYRRDDLEVTGGFDEGFVTPGGEDTDLGLRVEQRGATPLLSMEALVYHDVGRSSYKALLKQTLRWSDIPRVVHKHPPTRGWLFQRVFWKRSHPRALLALAGIVSVPFIPWPFSPLGLLLALPWVRFRTRIDPPYAGPRRRWLLLPHLFLVDLLEVAVMIRGSVRHRALVL
jgi:glycosyltransferase involved in cell wall biosynthesis